MYPQKMRRHSALLRCTPQNKRAGLSSPLESDRENLGAVSDDSQNSVIPYLLGSLQGHPTHDTHPPLEWGQQAQVKQAVPENARQSSCADLSFLSRPGLSAPCSLLPVSASISLLAQGLPWWSSA